MSCNGCRILRKGCAQTCLLRQCLESIDMTPQAQANATVFVAKFFGRAGLMSFISAVPPSQRPALFLSLLFEAVGRAVNPVGGAVGLLWSGNWHVCQLAVQTVLAGGSVQALLGLEVAGNLDGKKLKKRDDKERSDLELCLMSGGEETARRAVSPSEESETTTLGSGDGERKLLRLFN